MDLSTYEGRAAYIAKCEREIMEQKALIAAQDEQRRQADLAITQLSEQLTQSINAPLYALMAGIRAMK